MKKYLLILIVAIFCLPNEGFAQGHHNTYEWERHIANINHRQFFGESKAYRDGKRYIRVPIAISLRLAEVVVDPETNVSTARWIDGSEYVGDIRKGVIKGKGTMKYSEGGKYIGDWSEGRRWGVGLMHYSNGDMYSGEWMWDLPHGKGTFITAEGIAMKGRFQNGVPHGKFIMQAPDGSKYSARWIHGQIKEESLKPLEEKNTK